MRTGAAPLTGAASRPVLARLMITDPTFIAFNREAELAKRLACSGLTALRKATPSRPGIYYDAFFGRSNALERFAKLAWLIDECTQRNGAFPTDQDLRTVGHDIEALVKKATLIASKRGQSQPFPSDNITDHIIKFLSAFAERTRYYNIDFFVGGKSKGMGDPIKTWHAKVGAAILATPEMKAKLLCWRAPARTGGNSYVTCHRVLNVCARYELEHRKRKDDLAIVGLLDEPAQRHGLRQPARHAAAGRRTGL